MPTLYFPLSCSNYDEADEYCPHCDNHYVIPAKTPHMAIGVEADDLRVIGDKFLKDERMKNNDRPVHM